MNKTIDQWSSGDPYEYFMGRWSGMMAPVFLEWLDMPSGLSWLDLGCGTGALSEAINQRCRPGKLFCVDPSPQFLEKTKLRLGNKANFVVGDAAHIPLKD